MKAIREQISVTKKIMGCVRENKFLYLDLEDAANKGNAIREVELDAKTKEEILGKKLNLSEHGSMQNKLSQSFVEEQVRFENEREWQIEGTKKKIKLWLEQKEARKQAQLEELRMREEARKKRAAR